MLRLALLAGLLAVAVVGAPAAPGSVELFRFADPRIDESSGIVVSSYSDDVFFTHNDSGRPRLFAVDRTGRTLADIRLDGPRTRDVEDVARVGRVLWLADIGDNRLDRRKVRILRLPEPRVSQPIGRVEVRATGYRFRYADGRHDAESLLVQPGTGRIFVATKALFGRSAVYVAPPTLDPTGVNVLTKVSDVPLLPTGGAFSQAGDRLVLRSYRYALVWTVDDGDVAAALRQRPRRVDLPVQRQGEAVTFTRSGSALVISSEGAGSPVLQVPLPTGNPDDHERAAPRAGEPPARPWLLAVVAVTALGGLGAVTLRRRKRRRAS